MLRKPGQHLPGPALVARNAERQGPEMLTSDLIDARRQQRHVDGEFARQSSHDGVASACASKLHANDRLPTRDRLLCESTRQRDRDAVTKDLGEKVLRDRVLRVGEDIGYMSTLDDMAG